MPVPTLIQLHVDLPRQYLFRIEEHRIEMNIGIQIVNPIVDGLIFMNTDFPIIGLCVLVGIGCGVSVAVGSVR